MAEADRLRIEIRSSEDTIAGLTSDPGAGAGDESAPDTSAKNITAG
ncbi:hypothetical protein [Streptomyces halobius]|uniref:Uncharacterized protein n=1 Tax=Streptomyces halobius TaxID=2879846 RepID=A0ABY4MBD0_9ACTN|nr:hypothetical protein [Streptomyces halobius]UQA93715.1 hypothetical protein K9S39_19255 [Streptomyces halobius]